MYDFRLCISMQQQLQKSKYSIEYTLSDLYFFVWTLPQQWCQLPCLRCLRCIAIWASSSRWRPSNANADADANAVQDTIETI